MPKPRGGSISPLEKHAHFLLDLIEQQPDLTLDEVVLAMHKHRIPGSRTAVWRFFQRHSRFPPAWTIEDANAACFIKCVITTAFPPEDQAG